ncbi:MAG: hypothetical protein ABIK65_14875 [Candidatus Eisenbacteria bacterium]
MNDSRPRRLGWLGLVLISLLVSSRANAIPVLSLEPESTSVDVSVEFDLSVVIGAEPDTMSNVQVIFQFDPGVIEFVDAFEGSLYVASGYQSFFNVEEESSGTWQVFEVIFPFDSFIQPPGELLVLRFRALAQGFTDITFLSWAVMDINRVQILPVDAVGARVFVGTPTVGVEGAEAGVSLLRLDPPRPNPTRGSTRISFTLPPGVSYGRRLGVYDARGRSVRIFDAPAQGGTGEILWDGRDDRGVESPSGVYFFRLDGSEGGMRQKIVLLR